MTEDGEIAGGPIAYEEASDEGPAAYVAWVRHPSLSPAPATPTSSYLVCATPRTGSWLLCGLLASSGVAGHPHEWFFDLVEERNRRAWQARTAAEYVRLVRGAATTPNGVLGLKVMWGYFPALITRLRRQHRLRLSRADVPVLARHFPAPRFVWLRRTDTEAQARSWARALDTNVWGQWQPSASDDPPWREDPARVAELAAVIREHDAAWERWFAAEGIAPVTVAFEELVADPHGVAGGVLAALGLEHQGLTVLTAPTGAAR